MERFIKYKDFTDINDSDRKVKEIKECAIEDIYLLLEAQIIHSKSLFMQNIIDSFHDAAIEAINILGRPICSGSLYF